MKIINAFESVPNPLDIDADELTCILSGASMPPNISKHIENAEKVG